MLRGVSWYFPSIQRCFILFHDRSHSHLHTCLPQDLSRKVLRVRCPHAVEISRITVCIFRTSVAEGMRVMKGPVIKYCTYFTEKFCSNVLFWGMLRCTLAVTVYQTTRCPNPGDQIK